MLSLNNHLQFQTSVEGGRPHLTTVCGECPAVFGTVMEEGIRAAVLLSEGVSKTAPDPRLNLLLEYSYESLMLFHSFKSSGVKFDISVLYFTKLSDTGFLSWARKLAESVGCNLYVIEFDYASEEHLVELEKMQETTECAHLDSLFRIWAACRAEGFVVLPGQFAMPRFDHALRMQSWNLPGFNEHSLFRFFSHFGGAPFFTAYTPELVYAQAHSEFSRQLRDLALRENRYVPYNLELQRLFYKFTGFPLTADMEIRFQPEAFYRQAVKNHDRDKKERLAAVYNRMRKFQDMRPAENQSLDLSPADAPSSRAPALSEDLKKASRRGDIRGALIDTEISARDHGCFAAFPTLVSYHSFRGNLRRVMEVVEKSEFFRNQGNLITRTDLHLNPALEEAVRFFEEAVAFHLRQMAYIYDGIEITQCWANRSEKKQSHHHHYHPNCFLSGFFYLTSGGGGNTIFRIAQNRQLQPKKYAVTPWSSLSAEIAPEAGKLILFPAHLEHHTLEHEAPDPRYTISFNVMLRGEIGELSNAAWVKI